ncbi:MAG: TIGR03557 family F420-dependent LLM class oxidoreductase [Chloroflexi bacterium]|nr:TIGR03557 family F420-dependent LLM class oxidoreductase [Chloroflexota bacterium]MCC6896913.1 TIGR03557 family F420-dependent LLM class oxidoreductase [Anaerolineae bacterium]
MTKMGYALSSEEHVPQKLIQNAKQAEQAGFTFALISDHYHPWIDKQGESPYVWSVLGGIAQATTTLQVGTGVTCPIIRIHPAIIAQAAATVASMMPGRFFLGVGTGENLNEHITGEKWPIFDTRAEMLEEAVEIIRLLWQGGSQSWDGMYYTVENAQVYTLPDELPPIMLAASGEKAAELAGRIGDGLITTAPDKEVIEAFKKNGSSDRSMYGQVSVCWAKDEETGLNTALEWWPTAGLSGELNQELPTPAHFKQATQTVRKEDIAKTVACGNDPQKHLEAIQKFVDVGIENIYIHQIGPDQDGFLEFYQKHILPEFQ